MGVSIDLEVFFNWLIMLKLECLLRSWLSWWKYLQAIIASAFFISFQWLFSLILKLVFAFPTYSVCYIKCTPSNVAAWTVDVVEYLIYFFWFVFWVVVFRDCLQQSDLKFVSYGEHLPGFLPVFTFFDFVLFNFVTSY